MEAGHRGNEAEPQAIAGCRPALLQADKAVQHMLALFGRNARPGIGHHNRAAIALRGDRERHPPAAWGIFDRIINKIGQGLEQQMPIAAQARRLAALDGQRNGLILGHRLIEIDRIALDATRGFPISPQAST